MRHANVTLDALLRCGMPADEITWLMAADDPSIVHMLVELHAERLREELADKLRILAEVEGALVGSSFAAVGATDDVSRRAS